MKQIEKNVALEAVLARNIDKFVNVIGMTTTVLQMAAFLGIKTISLIRMCEIDYQTEIEKFFSNIGIEMPTNMSEIII
ncbi:hypothetical protein [Sinanaerobacter sp. ZZT-01]|uniref:hypothetical protein n=1 Tax=Sinanaerobacter sp. ZZT-01 TaxID=3111540 RepID=UPI002D78D159|nr:hypothetical protein [Sinanaerobacter sp. ZZT-01]WRR94883.1 hypothetical protein U5921_07125 [Sinanaerobacter sp. ZZT-01]